MPYPRGAHLVRRDYSVLAGLAMARYLSARQVARLAFANRNERLARRRLTRLGTTGASELESLVRWIRFRGPTGAPGRAWALTEAGHLIAKELVPHATLPASDVGAAFLEHTLLLNDVLVDLVLKASAGSDRWFADLPFRWLPEGAIDITFDYYDRVAQKIEKGRIRPDATLEIGEPRRRLFIECETGSQTLVSADPGNTGATWAKIQRYTHLLAGTTRQHEGATPYSVLCPDRFTAVLVFLTVSERRRDAVRKLVADPKRAVRINVRAFTLREAGEVLGALALGKRAPAAQPPVVRLTAVELELLGHALSQCQGSLDEARQTLERHNRSLQEPVRSVGPLRVPRSPEALREALSLLAHLRAAANEGGSPGANGPRLRASPAEAAGGQGSPVAG